MASKTRARVDLQKMWSGLRCRDRQRKVFLEPLLLKESINMGALPSQKYEEVLIAYHEYLLGLGVKIPNGTIKEFLKKADKREIPL